MNQPPPTETQTGKRIVSRGEYAKIQGKRIGMICLIVLLAFVALECGGSALSSLVGEGNVFYALCLAVMAYGFWIWGKASLKQYNQMEQVVVFTRANTADLPAPDSLVRASEEPVQEQQAVLLRAAIETAERHEEQLVRASAGGTERH